MIAPIDPPDFVVRTEAQKAAFDNGFRLERGLEQGWLRYGSTTAHGEIWIAGASSRGPWLLAVSHPGVAAEMAAMPPLAGTGPGAARFAFATLPELYAALDRVYRLAASLPDAPLRRFTAAIVGVPRATEAERLIVMRIGQDFFRAALLKYWGGCCPMSGITRPELLRASHIVPWAECETDALRLDVHNGLLLSALWDAAFDAGLVSFADDGLSLVSPLLAPPARVALRCDQPQRLPGVTPAHRTNLARHRRRHGFSPPAS